MQIPSIDFEWEENDASKPFLCVTVALSERMRWICGQRY